MRTVTPFKVDLLPRKLVIDPPMTDAELEAFCAENDLYRIERASDGVIWMNPPAGFDTSSANNELSGQLYVWWCTHERGRGTGSSGGFYLADGSLLSPDAACLLPRTLKGISAERRTRFIRCGPILSSSCCHLQTAPKKRRLRWKAGWPTALSWADRSLPEEGLRVSPRRCHEHILRQESQGRWAGRRLRAGFGPDLAVLRGLDAQFCNALT